jgi:predicted transcriptional regulator
MTKVVPVKMSDDLYERLQAVALKTGEPDSTIIRLVLRAGLMEIVKDNYQLFKFGFGEAGESIGADAGGPSLRSTRTPARARPTKPKKLT